MQRVSPAASSSVQSDLDPGRKGCSSWTPGSAPRRRPTALGPARGKGRDPDGNRRPTALGLLSLGLSSSSGPLRPPPPPGAFSTFVPNRSPSTPCVCLYAVCLSALHATQQLLSSRPQGPAMAPADNTGVTGALGASFPPCLPANKPGTEQQASGPSSYPGGLRDKTQTTDTQQVPREAWRPEVSSNSFAKHF